ncbi:P-loop containing nucleoside triphosphate hydrolase protein [Spinellus fusiger]|nr:P-loop containing nucleoside triphosphate hydrolase protein [Spinellus fusiger]
MSTVATTSALKREATLKHLQLVLDKVLTFLEKISEESFWESLLGQRLTQLGKRYFGNDFVMLSIIVYVTPILKTYWDSFIEYYFYNKKIENTVSVEVRPAEALFHAMDYFVKKNTKSVPGMTEAVAYYEPEEVHQVDTPLVKPLPKVGFYPLINTTAELSYKGHTIHVSRKSDGDEKVRRDYNVYLSFEMKGNDLAQLRRFMQEWADEYNEEDGDSVTIYRYGIYGWETSKTIEPRGFDTVALKRGLKEKILTDMETFLYRKKWYKSRGIPYRRGYLLYGPPGTGKSSLIQALASKLRMNIALINLTEVAGDSEFSEMLTSSPDNTIIVIEDLDHYLGGREPRLTMAGMLNALDGIQAQEGSMIFMTCNEINKLQPAMMRPGRIDMKIIIDYAAREQIEEMFWRFFGGENDTSESVGDERQAFLQDVCNQFADSIPIDHITTAELQTHFVSLLMESGIDQSSDEIYKHLVETVPEFLMKVKVDREQASQHSKGSMSKAIEAAPAVVVPVTTEEQAAEEQAAEEAVAATTTTEAAVSSLSVMSTKPTEPTEPTELTKAEPLKAEPLKAEPLKTVQHTKLTPPTPPTEPTEPIEPLEIISSLIPALTSNGN